MDIEVTIPAEVERQMRWQSSPLRRAIEEVVNSSKARSRGPIVSIGANKATRRIAFAALELTEIYDEIMVGTRDAMGYPV